VKLVGMRRCVVRVWGTMKWISVDDQLPLPNTKVIVCDVISKGVWIARFQEGKDDFYFVVTFFNTIEEDYFVSHWMPFPELPEVLE
jgi:hypothetical protein